MDSSAELCHRIRAALGPARMVREVNMFGGRCFMVDEKMVLSAMKDGDLLVRADPARSEEFLALDGARQAEMGTGRSMGRSWIAVEEEAISSDEQLGFWMDAALDYNATTAAP